MPLEFIGTGNKSILVRLNVQHLHYSDIIMSVTVSQITSLSIVYSAIYSGADLRKQWGSASLAFVKWGNSPVISEFHNSPHKEPVMQKMFPFNDVIMK